MTVLVGTTCAPYKTDDPRSVLSWLATVEELHATSDIQLFAALEVDARGEEPHTALITELEEAGGVYWTFSLDDRAETITGRNRLTRICAGRNLVTQYGHDIGASHILFVDSDVTVPGDAVRRLLEVDWPIVGGHIPTYCLNGPKVEAIDTALNGDPPQWAARIANDYSFRHFDGRPFPEGADVREHMNTAGFLLVRRDLFLKLRWRWSLDDGLTDDPCYHADAAALGYPTWVRHDVRGRHFPEQIGPVDGRGHDLTIHRTPVTV
ncbi:MAG TPA: hypothetical protein VHT75_04300 [Acidimicrobiales bacterium]|nr:hypothetical protein [Acidimicrobiales bacterium]